MAGHRSGGRKPTPIAEKIAAGNPGGRPLTPIVPEPPDGPMPMPLHIERNERARQYWHTTLAGLARGHLKPVDAPLLASYCMALALRDEATEKVEQTSIVIRAPKTGLPIQNPYLPIVNRQTELAKTLAVQLCITPAERNRIAAGLPSAPGANGGDDIFDA